jgi:hypothetical protein
VGRNAFFKGQYAPATWFTRKRSPSNCNEHENKLAGTQCAGKPEKHAQDLAVDDLLRKLELIDHAEGDGATARLAVVHLALKHVGVNVLLLRQRNNISPCKQTHKTNKLAMRPVVLSATWR